MHSADPSSPGSTPASVGRANAPRLSAWVPWTLVASLAILCLWLAQLLFMTRTENAVLRDQLQLAELELRSAQQHAEAERILAQRELSDLREQRSRE